MPDSDVLFIALNDGRRKLVRPIDATDRDRLRRFHNGLSLDSTRLRFFTPHPTLSDKELVHFTNVDHNNREAFVVLDDDDIIAVGRYDRTIGSDDAEVAFVVADEWQRNGIATGLFPLLRSHAVANGATCLVADTLAENTAMRTVFVRSGTALQPTWSHGVAETRMPIGDDDRA